jgi:hypothetical protein
VTVPALVFSVRPVKLSLPERLIPPFAFVIACVPVGVVHAPVVHMLPLVHVKRPAMDRVSVPERVPTDCVIVVPTLLPAVPLRVSVPPVIDSAFTNSAPSFTVRGPVVKVMLALLTRLVMV